MLTHLHITDFTLVERLDWDLSSGLTVLTGETGAGKSILLDALSLALGDRADADKIRAGCDKAEVSALFDISNITSARTWLDEQAIDNDECLIRRVVTSEGRSKAFVNGKPVTLAQLKQLGEMLIDIHSQHEHQSLLKVPTHRSLLDSYGSTNKEAKAVAEAFTQWRRTKDEYEEVKTNNDELNARFQLLSYQVEELNQLALEEHELESLEAQQSKLANREHILTACQQAVDICTDGEAGLETLLHRASRILDEVPGRGKRLDEALGLLNTALIQVEEARHEISADIDAAEDCDVDLEQLEQRLSAIYDIARKHRIKPEEVYALHQQLLAELAGLSSGDELLAQLSKAVDEAEKHYRTCAAGLSQLRAKAATKLGKKVNEQLKSLAMTHARLDIALETQAEPTRYGAEAVEFLISTVPGQPPKPLVKIASGGELSRVSLAIQVVTAASSVTPTLVLDEVDVGIGGTTGDVVGLMLRDLGRSAQVLCVTHLAQVASKADTHIKVEKTVNKKGATTDLRDLQGEEKIAEIARMMGGPHESKQSLAHAKAMLAEAG